MSGQIVILSGIVISVVVIILLVYFRAGSSEKFDGPLRSNGFSSYHDEKQSGQTGMSQEVQLGGNSPDNIMSMRAWRVDGSEASRSRLPAPYPSPFIGSSLARAELGEVSLLDSVLSRDEKSKSVGTSWYGLDEETLEVLAKAPPMPDGTSLDDPCGRAAADMYAWSAREIGRPSGVFSEPGSSTGSSLYIPAPVHASCLRASKTSIEGTAGCYEIEETGSGRPGLVPGGSNKSVRAARPSAMFRSTSESSPTAMLRGSKPSAPSTSQTIAVSPASQKISGEHMVIRGEYYDDLPGDWGAWSLHGYSPQAGTNMITPDLVSLPEIPQKCAYTTAGGMRILEDCGRYTMNRPADHNM